MLNQTQRRVIEKIAERAARGPCLGLPGQQLTREDAERGARLWAETWIEHPLRLVLDGTPAHVLKAEGWDR